MISLPITGGEEAKQFTAMTNFIVVDVPNTYNVIFDRSLLNNFKVDVSTYHVTVKFPVSGQQITMRGDLLQSRTYYLWAVKSVEEMILNQDFSKGLDTEKMIEEVFV